MTIARKSAGKHPNKVPFEGVLCRVDEPSDQSPGGAEGHPVMLPRAAAEKALETLEGMPVGFTLEWDRHGQRNRCGVITEAWIDGNDLCVRGHLFVFDFPEIATYLRKPGVEMGMSYEMADAVIRNIRAPIWEIKEVTFTGASVLLRNKAAYGKTKFYITACAAPAKPKDEDRRFNGVLRFEDAGRIRTLPACRPSKRS